MKKKILSLLLGLSLCLLLMTTALFTAAELSVPHITGISSVKVNALSALETEVTDSEHPALIIWISLSKNNGLHAVDDITISRDCNAMTSSRRFRFPSHRNLVLSDNVSETQARPVAGANFAQYNKTACSTYTKSIIYGHTDYFTVTTENGGNDNASADKTG